MPTGNGLHEPRDVCRELHAGHVLEPSRGNFLVRCGEDLPSGWENVEFCSRISGAESDFFWDMLCVYQIVLHYDETSRIDILGSQNRTARVTVFQGNILFKIAKDSKSQNYCFKDKMRLNLPQTYLFTIFPRINDSNVSNLSEVYALLGANGHGWSNGHGWVWMPSCWSKRRRCGIFVALEMACHLGTRWFFCKWIHRCIGL